MMLQGVASPRWAPKKVPTIDHPCVASSLTLFAPGGSNPSGGFHLRTLSIGKPLGNCGPILDTIALSNDVEDASCEELWWCITLVFITSFYRASRAQPLCLIGSYTTGL
jgi:hypothetical protein